MRLTAPRWPLGAALLAAAALALAWLQPRGDPSRSALAPAPASPPRFLGRAACASCHPAQAEAWSASHHACSMQQASPATTLGDFADATFTYAGTTTTFYRRGDALLVRTDGPGGVLGEHQVRFTLGVAPLQQLLVDLPGGSGRLQALGIAWDARPRAEGGQRWFHLYPEQRVTHDDPLHWTRPRQNWNAMCADCHSTDLRRAYDPSAGTYATTYAEMEVSCEACHGPGSAHLAWARGERPDLDGKGLSAPLDERRGVSWGIDPATGNARRSRPRQEAREVEACARCHARRGEIGASHEPGGLLGQAYRVALIEEGLYFADGQIRDEVFEHGSFLQSRMFHAGVTCSDCHDPHRLSLRAPGSDVCLRCHAAGRYRAAEHHHHPEGSPGASCVGCHMPARTYMVLDVRRDHGFRIPRPDRTVSLGTPNTCNACHQDRSAAWAAAQVRGWYGHPRPGFQAFAETLRAADTGARGARELLLRLAADRAQPGIARASALARLDGDPPSLSAARALLGDADPLVRRAAAGVYAGADPRAARDLLPVLGDPVRDVRLEAARWVVRLPLGELDQASSRLRERALEEYLAAQRALGDHPEAATRLGAVLLDLGLPGEARAAYQRALSLDPACVPAAVNLADLYRREGREEEGAELLRSTLSLQPEAAVLHHALGLFLVRAGRAEEALAELRRAVELAPGDRRLGQVLELLLRERTAL